jgi:hypothetical protein
LTLGIVPTIPEFEMVNPKRRASDAAGDASGQYNKCPMWNTHLDLEETLAKIMDQNAKQLEIIEAWDSVKGAGKVLSWLAKVGKWILAISAGFTALVAFLKYVARVI